MEEIHMTRSMTKYQLEHFKSKVRRQFEPLIEDQELLVKQFKAKATDVAVAKLSKKIGADKIIKEFAEAERKLEEARATAITFFEKKKPQDAELDYSFRRKKDSYSDSKLSLSDCEDQLRTWASNQAEKELERSIRDNIKSTQIVAGREELVGGAHPKESGLKKRPQSPEAFYS
jgi:hypothetical protein